MRYARATADAPSPRGLDGSGYPDGLAGEAIPLSARILTIAHSYDAHDEAGRTLDPTLFDLFQGMDLAPSTWPSAAATAVA